MSSSAELQREREVQGYFQSWQIAQGSSLKVARSVDSISAPSQINDAHTPQPSSDKALSAFAQLAVFRLNWVLPSSPAQKPFASTAYTIHAPVAILMAKHTRPPALSFPIAASMIASNRAYMSSPNQVCASTLPYPSSHEKDIRSERMLFQTNNPAMDYLSRM
ncbi:hypothetical protein LB505_003813 [Fusarium chuoi]|nr:hypothetical protein LB505_003813 [Fusarium chuoi]